MQLTRRQTMKRASEFALVRARGCSQAGRFLVLNVLPMPEGAEEESRFGIITTKRCGCAVVRNRLRRRVRELLRAHGAPLQRGYFVVVVLRRRAADVDYAALERDLLRLLQRRTPNISPAPC
ncbi:MAG: ribonuclease P protein component [Akkermansia sp.]